MPVVKNVATLISDSSEKPGFRTAIFVDMLRNVTVWANFVYPYDVDSSLSAIIQHFDETVRMLSASQKTRFEPAELPILTAIGRYKVTIITRSKTGDIVSIRDGNPAPVDGYMGVGG